MTSALPPNPGCKAGFQGQHDHQRIGQRTPNLLTSNSNTRVGRRESRDDLGNNAAPTLFQFVGTDPSQIALKESAYTTEFFVGARAAAPADASVKNRSTVYFMNEQYKDFAIDSVQKLVSKGVDGVSTIKSSAKDLPEIVNLVHVTAAADPMVVHGLATMGIMKGTSITEAFEQRAKYIESIEAIEGPDDPQDQKRAMR